MGRMNTARPQAPDRPNTDGPPQYLHEEIAALAVEQGLDVFVFATEGRLIGASPGCYAQTIEQIAATSSGLVNGARGYGDRTQVGSVERLVTRYAENALILLSINEAIWAGCVTEVDRVIETARVLSLFAERIASLVPSRVGLSLPAVALAEAGNEARR